MCKNLYEHRAQCYDRDVNGTIPLFDPQVEYISVSKIRNLQRKALRELRNPLAVLAPGGTQPLAVIIPFHLYMFMQTTIMNSSMSNVGPERE
jgi:hypothetical protein